MDRLRVAPKLANAVRDLRRALEEIVDPYRPELHYMRGPGPKWHEAHAANPAATAGHEPVMAKLHA